MSRSGAFLSIAATCAAVTAVAIPGAGAASPSWCAKAAKKYHATVAFKDGSVSLLRVNRANYSLCSDTKHRVVSAQLNDSYEVTQFFAFPGKCAYTVTRPKGAEPEVGYVDLHAVFAAGVTSVGGEIQPLAHGVPNATVEKVVASSSCFVAASESIVQANGPKLRQIQMFGTAPNPDTDTAIQVIPCSAGTSDADLRHLKISGHTASWLEAGKKVTHVYGASTG